MSSMLKMLQKNSMAVRKERTDTVAISLYSTLIGYSINLGKAKENRDPTDEEVISVIKSTLKGVQETIERTTEKNGSPDANALKEEAILKMLLPKQMSEDDLRNVIKTFKESTPDAAMGQIMAYLKATHTGTYDGKLASTVAKEFI